MNTKKYFTTSFCALALAIVGFSFSPSSALALDWGLGYNSATGGVNIGVGSNNSGAGNVWGGGNSMRGSWSLTNPYGLPSGSILGIASNLLFWLLAIFAVAGIVGFVLSGIFYLLAGADEGNIEKGKKGMLYSIVGIVVGLSGFIIMQAVNMLLGGVSKTF